jgi:hypothetical protein
MARSDIIYSWEKLPEYRAAQQLGRTTGRVLMSLPRRLRWIIGRTLIRGPALIAQGIAGANADMPPGETLSEEERETFRRTSLQAVGICREAFRLLKSERIGSIPDVMVGMALLDRIERALRGAARG